MQEDANKENLPIEENKPLEHNMQQFEEILKKIEQTGKTDLQWIELKMNFIEKYKQVIIKYYPLNSNNNLPNDPMSDSNEYKVNNIDEDIIEYITNLNKMPFTLQRMAELMLSPEKYYKTANKYNSAFKKLVNIDTD